MRRNMTKLLLFSLPLVVLLCACSSTRYQTVSFYTMDTYGTITASGMDEALLREAQTRVQECEKTFSKTYKSSRIYAVNHGGNADEETITLLGKALSIADDTDGAFDPTLGSLTSLWNVTAENPVVPSHEAITEALSHVGYEKLTLDGTNVGRTDDELTLDLGAIVKGYAGDCAARVLRENGAEDGLVSLGGNVTVFGCSEKNRRAGKAGWDIAITNPYTAVGYVGHLTLTDVTVSVSGDYERYFTENGRRFHHILDRGTGYPADSSLRSVAVIAPDGTEADALSTALFVMGRDKAVKFYESGLYDFEAVFCSADGSVTVTDGLLDRFIPNHDAVNEKGAPLMFPQF